MCQWVLVFEGDWWLSNGVGCCQLLQDGGWWFDSFNGICILTWHSCGWRWRSHLHQFHSYRLGWGSDVAREQVVGGGQVMGNSAGSGWGQYFLFLHVFHQIPGISVESAWNPQESAFNP